MKNYKRMKWKWYYRIGAKLRMWRWMIVDRITGLLPTKCIRCGGWWLQRDTRDVKSTMGMWVPVCLRCYKDLYGEE